MRASWIGPAVAAVFAVLCAAPTCTPGLGELDLFDDLDTIYIDDGPVSVLFENFSSFDIELSVTYDDEDDVVRLTQRVRGVFSDSLELTGDGRLLHPRR